MKQKHHSEIKRFAKHCRLFFAALIFFSLSHCTGALQKFLDEDTPLVLTTVYNTADDPTYSMQGSTLSFSITFQIDRRGKYRVYHGTSCETGKDPADSSLRGALEANENTSVTVTLKLGDFAAYGRSVILCAEDVASYQKKSTVYNVLLNEGSGTGIPFSSAPAGEFVFFQPDWISGDANRGLPSSASADSARSLSQQIVFIDPNDDYKFRYFVADSANHRVLIFHTMPVDSSAAADVVIGQTNFTENTENANLGFVSASGFKTPTMLAVSSTGILYIVDKDNNRILGYNQIPKTSGADADFVLGQPNFSDNIINNPALSADKRFNALTGVGIYRGKLFVADQANNRILVFNTLPTTNAPAADWAIGQGNTTSSAVGTDYELSSNYLRNPQAIYFHDAKLYLTDYGNHRVLVYNTVPAASDARPDFVIGHAYSWGLSANCSISVNNKCFNLPQMVAAQGSKLAIADLGNHRVLFFDLPIVANFATAQYVLGQAGMTTNGAATSQVGLNQPRSVVFDGDYLWITDVENNRVVVRQLPY